MSVIILILLVSIGIAAAFLMAFLWGVKDGQFDDAESPAQRMLFDTSSDSYRTSSVSENSAGSKSKKIKQSTTNNI